MNDSPSEVMVSVVTLAYNQERYIRQALDSILMQECDFTVECIVGDDCSSDSTAAIIREYEQRHPDRIKPVIRTRNVGARRNLADLLDRCSGRYVAVLDGDDYWTSPHKLQRQVEFMQANPECALSFHGVYAVDEAGEPHDMDLCCTRPTRSEITDLLHENFISTCTVMYRWGLVGKLPDWFFETWISDYSIHVLHARHGWIGFIDEVMAAYRIHGDGMWSGEHAESRMQEFVKTLHFLDAELDYRYHDLIERSIHLQTYCEFTNRFHKASKLFAQGRAAEARRLVPWLLLHLKRRDDISLSAVAVLVARSTLPWLVQPLVGAKSRVRQLLNKTGSGSGEES